MVAPLRAGVDEVPLGLLLDGENLPCAGIDKYQHAFSCLCGEDSDKQLSNGIAQYWCKLSQTDGLHLIVEYFLFDYSIFVY